VESLDSAIHEIHVILQKLYEDIHGKLFDLDTGVHSPVKYENVAALRLVASECWRRSPGDWVGCGTERVCTRLPGDPLSASVCSIVQRNRCWFRATSALQKEWLIQKFHAGILTYLELRGLRIHELVSLAVAIRVNPEDVASEGRLTSGRLIRWIISHQG
jgi:hypothetical protein